MTSASPPPRGLTLEALAQAKKLPVDFLMSLGIQTDLWTGKARVRIPYMDDHGTIQSIRYRLALDGDMRFAWRKDDHVLLYGLPRLRAAVALGWVLIVEGESDCWTAWHHGLPAVGIPGKSTWRPEWATFFTRPGLEVVLWCEPDAPGLVAEIARDIADLRVIIPPADLKDLSDAHVRGERVSDFVAALRKGAQLASAFLEGIAAEGRAAAGAEALEAGRALLEDPDLLERVAEILKESGLAGDPKNAKVLYLDITSRLLRRPVNRLIEGPSGSGKNYLLDHVLRLFPDEAYYRLTAASERAFVFTAEDFQHRIVVIDESAGLHQDGIGATIMRNLAWGKGISYEVVEKIDGEMQTRRIDKLGPTGLITTTVRTIDAEMQTRLLTITIPDTPEFTKLVIEEIGRQMAAGPAKVDVGAFVAAQRWLGITGVREVIVPYGPALSALAYAGSVRMRRDFQQLATTIETSALLHQLQRERDEEGRILASPADYRIAYDLAAESLREAAGGLTLAQTEAVSIVEALCASKGPEEGVSRAKIAAALNLDPSAVTLRLRKPLHLGIIVNLETVKGKPARYRPGSGIPESVPVIPTPEELFKDAYV